MRTFHGPPKTALTLLLALIVLSLSALVAKSQSTNQLVISEFMASNATALLDEDGEASDWLEIHNAGSTAIDLQGYSLTDDSAVVDKWVFPSTILAPGEYLVVFASSKERSISGNQLHTNFNLSAGGEYLGLADSSGAVISAYAPEYPQQYSDISYGFASDGSGEFYETPTPGSANGAGVYPYPPVSADRPTSSLARGFYASPQSVTLSAEAGALIRYTTDGSTPTETNGTDYTGPLTIGQTTTLRAISVLNGTANSKVATFTYIFLEDVLDQSTPVGWPTATVNDQIFDYEMDPEIVTGQREAVKDALASLPAVSIVTDIDNLFDPTTGIYVNAEERGREWERETSVELLNPDNTPAFQIDAGVRMRGGFSRRGENPKHSMRLYFRSEYDGDLTYPLFEDEGVDTFQILGLRTAQNNSWSFQGDGKHTFLRDIWQRDTQRDMGHPYTRSRYVHLYINGQYWGIYMTQEDAKEEYAASYFGGDEDEYDVIKSDSANNNRYEISAGDSVGWDALWPLIQDQVVTDVEYATLAESIDLDNLIDSMLIRFHAGDNDGVISGYEDNLRANNWVAMQNRTGGGIKWTFIVHDGEASMGVVNLGSGVSRVEIDRVGPFPTLTGNEFYLPDYFNPGWLHQALATNAQYQERFQYRTWLHMNEPGGVLTESESRARWDARKAEVAPAILAESARWGDAKREPAYTINDWQNATSFVENSWFPARNPIFFAQLAARNLAADPPPGPPVPPAPPSPKMILNEYNAVDSDEVLKDDGSDTFFGQVTGNGGDWFELVTIEDGLDIRGWQLELWDTDNFAEVPYRSDLFIFADDPLLANLQAGTILTIAEDVADDPSYDPANGDWWINLQANSDDEGAYFTPDSQSNFDTNNTNWQLIIRDAAGNLVFGPAGEGIGQIESGVGSTEVAKLEENPSTLITPDSQYSDGATSTFGAPNQWSGGSESQDFSALRGSEPVNVPPTADAGPDQTIVDSDNSGSESITLDGSGSSDSDGTIVSYSWSSDTDVSIPDGINPTADFPVGIHNVTLTVTDDDGATATDQVVITVNAGAVNIPPTADAGPGQTIVDSDNSGSESITLDGSGSSDSDGTIVSYSWSSDTGISIPDGPNPVVNFPVGAHTVTLTVTDDDGATATDQVVITINAGASGCGALSQEAEIGILTGNFVVGADANASGGSYVHAPEGVGNKSFSQNHIAEYCVTIPTAGNYRINALVYAEDTTSDSFFVTIDNQFENVFVWDIPNVGSYVPDFVGQRGENTPIILPFTAGDHILKFHQREDGARLDSFVFELVDTGPLNSPPVVTSPGSQINFVDDIVNLQIVATDADNDTLSYSATALPAGLAIDQSTGLISGIPTTANIYNSIVVVNDGSESTSVTIQWTVNDSVGECGALSQEAEDGNLFGDFAIGSDTNASGGSYIHVPEGSGNRSFGNDSQAIYCFTVTTPGIYKVVGNVHAANGTSDSFFVTINGQPSNGYLWPVRRNTEYLADELSDNHTGMDPVTIALPAGEHTIALSLREDGTRLDRLALVLVDGGPTNNPPTITTPDDQNNLVGDSVSLQIIASDIDEDIISYAATNLPIGLNINANTGLISGTPSTAGTYSPSVTVSDGSATATANFNWTIGESSSCGGLSQEAEDGTLFGDFEIVTNANASGGSYVHTDESAGDGQFGSSSRIVFCFNVPSAGSYQIQARTRGPSGTSNSFWVTVDGLPNNGALWDLPASNNFINDFVNNRGVADPLVLNLSAGEHTVIVYKREDGTRLDTISLVPSGVNAAAAVDSNNDELAAWGVMGTLVDADGTNAAAGTIDPRLVDQTVVLADAATRGQVHQQSVQTDEHGQFFFDAMPLGEYVVMVDFDGESWEEPVTTSDGEMSESVFRLPLNQLNEEAVEGSTDAIEIYLPFSIR